MNLVRANATAISCPGPYLLLSFSRLATCFCAYHVSVSCIYTCTFSCSIIIIIIIKKINIKAIYVVTVHSVCPEMIISGLSNHV